MKPPEQSMITDSTVSTNMNSQLACLHFVVGVFRAKLLHHYEVAVLVIGLQMSSRTELI